MRWMFLSDWSGKKQETDDREGNAERVPVVIKEQGEITRLVLSGQGTLIERKILPSHPLHL